MSRSGPVREVVQSEQFPERAGDVAAALSYLALALLGEERRLGRVRPALTVRRHVTAVARELQGQHKPKPKPKHRLRKVLGAALLAAVVIAALRKGRAEP
jgi:hypothetical protein